MEVHNQLHDSTELVQTASVQPPWRWEFEKRWTEFEALCLLCFTPAVSTSKLSVVVPRHRGAG